MASSSSNAVFSLGYPRSCHGCGRTVKADCGWFETVIRPGNRADHYSWHYGCRKDTRG